MALIATHIRFAIDLLEHYPIRHLERYISGTVYPDSRWVSKIDRPLTHDEKYVGADFPDSDFTRGWQVHVFCDMLQNGLHESLMDDLPPKGTEDWWVRLSVAKIVQDMNDLKHFDADRYFSYLEYVEAPNGEELSKVKKFNDIIRSTYSNVVEPKPSDYPRLWVSVGLESRLAEKLVDALADALADEKLCRRIEHSYERMLAAC